MPHVKSKRYFFTNAMLFKLLAMPIPFKGLLFLLLVWKIKLRFLGSRRQNVGFTSIPRLGSWSAPREDTVGTSSSCYRSILIRWCPSGFFQWWLWTKFFFLCWAASSRMPTIGIWILREFVKVKQQICNQGCNDEQQKANRVRRWCNSHGHRNPSSSRLHALYF